MTDQGYATENVTAASADDLEELRPLVRAIEEVAFFATVDCDCWRCVGREPDDTLHGQAGWTA